MKITFYWLQNVFKGLFNIQYMKDKMYGKEFFFKKAENKAFTFFRKV